MTARDQAGRSEYIPTQLPPNPVPVYYGGGSSIARFRGIADFPSPEDWIGSLVEFRMDGLGRGHGLSRTATGDLLSDLIATDASGWLGDAHSQPRGGLLVKLLDAGERLPVHWHPGRAFALEHLGSCYGKAEAWVVLSPTARVWLGFAEEPARREVRGFIDAQDTDALLSSTVVHELARGDVVFVPPGTIHAVEAGALLLELQEPTSFSLLAEYRRLGVTETNATLGLGWERALDALVFGPLGSIEEQNIRRGAATIDGVHSVLPSAADEFFTCVSVRRAQTDVTLHRGLIAVVVDGDVRLRNSGESTVMTMGESWFLPAGLGLIHLDAGAGQVLLCAPAAPDARVSMTESAIF